MDQKSLAVLEFDHVLERLAAFASFSLSRDLALKLNPTADEQLVRQRQQQTSEARKLLSLSSDLSMGGISDVRAQLDLAGRGGVLTPQELLEVKSMLVGARTLLRSLAHLPTDYPALAEVIQQPPQPVGLIEAITRCLSERGEVLDAASDRLAAVRRDLKSSREKLLSRLERFIVDPHSSPMLQEGIITQRDGRYVLPLRSEYKGQIKAIIHDQSASGATLFVEPLAVVDMNNQFKELQLAERDEERRVLVSLSQQVGVQAADIVHLLDLLAALDLIFARARYADAIRAVEPVIAPYPAISAVTGSPLITIRLYQARHPLLDPELVVPVDLVLDAGTYSMILTGPNTGGKTVTLKTVGLFCLMAQSGLHIPAASGSEISLFRNVFADIGDEQSIEQSLSTFSGHITNIIHILKRADSKSLVLLDELGAGTDPQEGAALAMAIMTELLRRGITNFVATHYPELKTFAHSTPGVVNASLEFDLKTLRPTYRLAVGLPGRSNALAIAERLGLPAEIIASARSAVHPDELRAESLLDEIYAQRGLAREDRSQAQEHLARAAELERQLAGRLRLIEEERQAVLAGAQHRAEDEFTRLRSELEDLRRQLQRAHQPLDAVKAVERNIDQLVVDIQEGEKELPGQDSIPSGFSPGSRVEIVSLGMPGRILSMGSQEAEVQAGNLRVRARLSDLRLPGSAAQDVKVRQPRRASARLEAAAAPTPAPEVGMELDIRGQRAEDGLDLLARYLDRAYSGGMPFVRIIHGKGTGRLRQVVREALKNNPQVKDFEEGKDGEGGDGVTVAHLRSDD